MFIEAIGPREIPLHSIWFIGKSIENLKGTRSSGTRLGEARIPRNEIQD
jgi:hypothetical protein